MWQVLSSDTSSSYDQCRSTDQKLLTMTRYGCYGDHSFSVAEPFLWNALPSAIRNANALPSFKAGLKTVFSARLFATCFRRYVMSMFQPGYAAHNKCIITTMMLTFSGRGTKTIFNVLDNIFLQHSSIFSCAGNITQANLQLVLRKGNMTRVPNLSYLLRH